MLGCPHCKTWLHEECILESIKASLHARLAAGDDPAESAGTITTASAAAEAEGSEKTVAKKGGRGRKSLLSSIVEAAALAPAPATNGKKGKGKKGVKSSTKNAEDVFEVEISSDGSSPKVIIRDLRVKEGDEKGTWEEDVKCLLCEGVVA